MANSFAKSDGSINYGKYLVLAVMTVLLVFSASLVRADEHQLMINGKITSQNGAIYFSPGDMAASSPIEVVTNSPWTTGKTRFRGVLLRDILDKVEADGSVLKATAADGFTVDIPISDAEEYKVIIAYKMDGEWLEEGVYAPFWIIYPYDTDKNLAQEKYYGRSIWQLTKITVE
ncbi:molybdopterin-dependent oxidoreductase [uncultured Sneathiella sp.]|nr:molybdopterin-dependent oxidoreductase [uncultured Sneathiella sp.]